MHYCVLWISSHLQIRSESQLYDHVHFNMLLCLVGYLLSADQVWITIPQLHSQYHAYIHFNTLLCLVDCQSSADQVRITIVWMQSQQHDHIHNTTLVFTLTCYCILWITCHLQFRSESQYQLPWSCSFKSVIVSCGLLVIYRPGQYHTTTIVFTLTHCCVLWITCHLQIRSESQYHDLIHLKVSPCLVDYNITSHIQTRSVSHYNVNDCVHFNALPCLVGYQSSADQVSITLPRLYSLNQLMC